MICILLTLILIISAFGCVMAHPGPPGHEHGPEEITTDDVEEATDSSDASSHTINDGSSDSKSHDSRTSSKSSGNSKTSDTKDFSSESSNQYSTYQKSYNDYESASQQAIEEVVVNDTHINETKNVTDNDTAQMTNNSVNVNEQEDNSLIVVLLVVIICIVAVIAYLKFIR